MDNDPETLLRRLHDRDAEIGVLLQRAHLLNRRAPPAVGGVIDHGFELHGGMGSYDEMGSYGALKEKLFVVCGCQEKVRSCHQCGLGTLWARTTIQSSPDKRVGHIYCMYDSSIAYVPPAYLQQSSNVVLSLGGVRPSPELHSPGGRNLRICCIVVSIRKESDASPSSFQRASKTKSSAGKSNRSSRFGAHPATNVMSCVIMS